MLARCCTNYASLFVDGWLMVEEMEENGGCRLMMLTSSSSSSSVMSVARAKYRCALLSLGFSSDFPGPQTQNSNIFAYCSNR